MNSITGKFPVIDSRHGNYEIHIMIEEDTTSYGGYMISRGITSPGETPSAWSSLSMTGEQLAALPRMIEAFNDMNDVSSGIPRPDRSKRFFQVNKDADSGELPKEEKRRVGHLRHH